MVNGLRYLIPSDDSILEITTVKGNDVTLTYIRSKVKKGMVTMSKEQLEKNLRTEVFKKIEK